MITNTKLDPYKGSSQNMFWKKLFLNILKHLTGIYWWLNLLSWFLNHNHISTQNVSWYLWWVNGFWENLFQVLLSQIVKKTEFYMGEHNIYHSPKLIQSFDVKWSNVYRSSGTISYEIAQIPFITKQTSLYLRM